MGYKGVKYSGSQKEPRGLSRGFKVATSARRARMGGFQLFMKVKGLAPILPGSFFRVGLPLGTDASGARALPALPSAARRARAIVVV